MQILIHLLRKFKVVIYNILILLLCLFIIEAFFILNANFHFLKKPAYYFYETDYLSLEESEIKYGSGAFAVPQKHRALISEDLYNIPYAKIDEKTKRPLFELLKSSNIPASVRVQEHLLPPYENKIVYDVEYSIDKNHRRTVYNQEKKQKTAKYLLALGDSFTFGAGVTSGQDYPSQLAEKISNRTKIYNLGKPGFGPNDLLFQLQSEPRLLSDISEKEGVAIWLFIEDHIERFVCDLKCYQNGSNKYILGKPRYSIINDKLVHLGSFSEAVNLKRKLFYYLGQSEALKYSGFRPDYKPEDLNAVVTGLNEIKTILEQKNNLKKFYILFLGKFNEKQDLIDLLKRKDFGIIDISDIPVHKIKNMRIPFDGHPTSNYYWTISEILKKYAEL